MIDACPKCGGTMEVGVASANGLLGSVGDLACALLCVSGAAGSRLAGSDEPASPGGLYSAASFGLFSQLRRLESLDQPLAFRRLRLFRLGKPLNSIARRGRPFAPRGNRLP